MAHDQVLLWIDGVAGARAFRRLDHMLQVVQGMEVRTTDSAGEGLDQHLANARFRIGDLGANQLGTASHHSSHHIPLERLLRG